MHPSHFLFLLSRRRMPVGKSTTKWQTLRTYADIFLRQEASKEKKKKRGYIIQSSGFALTSTQGVTSLPHNSTKSHHSAIPITTAAFLNMPFNFPLGTMPCLSHPTGFYLKTSQSTLFGNASTCITTPMTISITYLPQNSLGSCSGAEQLPPGTKAATPARKGDTRIAGVLNRFLLWSKRHYVDMLMMQDYSNSPLPHIYLSK